MPIRSIRIQILTIRKGFEAFECKFEPFERDSKYSNANSNHSKGIQSIRMPIRGIRIQILTIRNGFEALEAIERHLNGNSNNSNQIRSIRMEF